MNLKKNNADVVLKANYEVFGDLQYQIWLYCDNSILSCASKLTT